MHLHCLQKMKILLQLKMDAVPVPDNITSKLNGFL